MIRGDVVAAVRGLKQGSGADLHVLGGTRLVPCCWSTARAAPYADPPLRSVSLHVTPARITVAFYDHGVAGLTNALNWAGPTC
ncbi:MAG: hypothetical protein ABJB47_02390 [Actinomycetota bacterium]